MPQFATQVFAKVSC